VQTQEEDGLIYQRHLVHCLKETISVFVLVQPKKFDLKFIQSTTIQHIAHLLQKTLAGRNIIVTELSTQLQWKCLFIMVLLRHKYSFMETGDMQLWTLTFQVSKKGVFWLHSIDFGFESQMQVTYALTAVCSELIARVTQTLVRQ
jgi:hypothetical protein